MTTTNELTAMNYKSSEPRLGMGATLLLYSDRHAYTIIGISKSGKTLTLQRDEVTRVDKNGMSEAQIYEYAINPNGHIIKARYNAKRRQWLQSGGDYRPVVMLGDRREFYDFTF